MHERLETDRLVLRMFGNDDLDAYYAICSDLEVMEFIGQGNAMTRLNTWRQIAVMLGHWQLRGYGSWAIEEKESGKLVGRVGFINPEGWPGLEIGWALGREFMGSRVCDGSCARGATIWISDLRLLARDQPDPSREHAIGACVRTPRRRRRWRDRATRHAGSDLRLLAGRLDKNSRRITTPPTMHLRVHTLLIGSALFALTATAQEKPVKPTENVDTLTAKNIQAKGGAQALQAMQSLQLKGKLLVNNGQMEMAFAQTKKRPENVRSELTLQGMTMVQAYDGKEGWKISPFQGARIRRRCRLTIRSRSSRRRRSMGRS
jgi:hypothetical protein